MGWWLARCTCLMAALLVGEARAQTYPTIPDHTRMPGWWGSYSWQGPLPMQQQPTPGVEGHPFGWTGGSIAPAQRVPPSWTRPQAEVAPPPHAPRLPPGLTERDFYASRELPRGVREALTRVLPTGGVELYLLLEPGAQLLPNLAGCARELMLLDGAGTAAIGAEEPRPMREGERLGVPPNAPHELACGAGGPCLVQVRTDGPLRLQWLPRR